MQNHKNFDQNSLTYFDMKMMFKCLTVIDTTLVCIRITNWALSCECLEKESFLWGLRAPHRSEPRHSLAHNLFHQKHWRNRSHSNPSTNYCLKLEEDFLRHLGGSIRCRNIHNMADHPKGFSASFCLLCTLKPRRTNLLICDSWTEINKMLHSFMLS